MELLGVVQGRDLFRHDFGVALLWQRGLGLVGWQDYLGWSLLSFAYIRLLFESSWGRFGG